MKFWACVPFLIVLLALAVPQFFLSLAVSFVIRTILIIDPKPSGGPRQQRAMLILIEGLSRMQGRCIVCEHRAHTEALHP